MIFECKHSANSELPIACLNYFDFFLGAAFFAAAFFGGNLLSATLFSATLFGVFFWVLLFEVTGFFAVAFMDDLLADFAQALAK